MRFVLALCLLSLSSAFAATTNPLECLKQKKALDRRYCLDSYLESIKDAHDAEVHSMSNGIPEANKNARIAALQDEIAAKQDYLNNVKAEIELEQKLLDDVKNAKVAAAPAPVAPKPEKKKKKHKGFSIKL
ncbi:MAG: hypothetical protein ACJ76H_05225 [Bacteriovoracaceae bacterium]